MKAALQIEAVHSAYQKRPIIRGVSLALRPGQTVSLIGPNGAGKSTLLKIVAGFLEASGGRVLLEGHDIRRLAPFQRTRLGMGYLMQGGRVFQNLTVTENLELAAFGLARSDKTRNIEEIAELLELKSALRVKAGLLSGGWQQLLAVGMVLVKKSRVLLLDEPLAGLSPQATQRLVETLDAYRITNNAAILIAEQNVEASLGISQRAMALVNGQIAAETKQPGKWIKEGIVNPRFWRDTLQGYSL